MTQSYIILHFQYFSPACVACALLKYSDRQKSLVFPKKCFLETFWFWSVQGWETICKNVVSPKTIDCFTCMSFLAPSSLHSSTSGTTSGTVVSWVWQASSVWQVYSSMHCYWLCNVFSFFAPSKILAPWMSVWIGSIDWMVDSGQLTHTHRASLDELWLLATRSFKGIKKTFSESWRVLPEQLLTWKPWAVLFLILFLQAGSHNM